MTHILPEYEVINSSKSDPIYSSLSEINWSAIEPEQEELIVESLKMERFLDISGEIALYIMKKVPGVLKYMKARYKAVFVDEYQDCGKYNMIFLLCCVKWINRSCSWGY